MLRLWCNGDNGCSTSENNELPSWFKKYSTICITFPIVGTMLLSIAVGSSDWEVMHFNDSHHFFGKEGNFSGYNRTNIHFVGGIWSVCQIEKEVDNNRRYDFDGRSQCLDYIRFNQEIDNTKCIHYLFKMQNNIIACIIVVFLCILAIVVIGIMSLKAMLISATMVTSVLSLTSALFVIFANIIYHIKLHKLETTWGPCFPLKSIDERMFNQTNIISVETQYPLYVSWASAVLYFLGFCFWNHLTRNMNAEFSASFV